MTALPEFDRTATLSSRAALFATQFQGITEDLTKIHSPADLAPGSTNSLIGFKGHLADWTAFKEEITAERLESLSWTEAKELHATINRVEMAVLRLYVEVSRVKGLLGI